MASSFFEQWRIVRGTIIALGFLATMIYRILGSALALGALLHTVCSPDCPAGQNDNAEAASRARSFLAEATDLASQVENLRDRMVVYVRIGEVSGKSGDKASAKKSFDKALAIIDNLPRDENSGDLREFDRALIAEVRAQAGDIEGAQRTLAQIKVDSAKWMVLFEIALAQAHSGDFASAVRTAHSLKDSGNMDDLLGMIANQQATAGDIPGATKLARSIETASYRAESLAYIAAVQKEKGQVDEAAHETREATRIASESEQGTGTTSLAGCAAEEPEPPRDAALQRVAEIQAYSGDISQALETLGHLTNLGARENVLANVAMAQADSGDISGAETTIAAIGRDSCKAAALNGVAQALFDANNLSGAIAVVDTISAPNEKANRLIYFGRQLVKNRQLGSALEVLRSALKTSKLIEDSHDRASSLEEIARVQASAGSPSEAAQTLAEAAPAAFASYQDAKRDHAWSAAFPGFIELEVELGDFKGALANLSRLQDSDRVLVVQNAARERAKTGDTEGALGWADLQASARDKALAFIGVAEGILSPMEPKGP